MNEAIPPTTPSPALLPETPAEPGHHRGRRAVLAWVLSVLGVVIVIVMVAGFLIHFPYVIISPGSATPLDGSVVQIKGARTYRNVGNVLFLTVRVSAHDPNFWGLARAWLDPDRDVEKRTAVVGCLSDTENQVFNTELMDQSQNDAKYVALTRLGYTVPAEPAQIRVIEVCPGVPAYGKLHAGDRILAIDDHTITNLTEVAPLVQHHKPGDPVRIAYERGGSNGTVVVESGRVAGAGTRSAKCVPVHRAVVGTPCLGITSEPFVSYQFPIDVQIDTQRVGGPSAGLAFAVAIIDDLTPGNVTGGKRVAITGAIAPDGSVQEVGGVEQKAITARTNGVQLMIVPQGEVKDARRGAGKVPVVGVSTFGEALAALQRAGGAPVPPSPSTAARS
jgi:PDZ domain-containing protein